jgi:hypothetical protein
MPRTKTHFDQVPVRLVKEKIAMAEVQPEETIGIPNSTVKPVSPEREPPEGDTPAFPQNGTIELEDSTHELRYPKWQGFFQDALLELDKDKLKMRVVAAERAMRHRLDEIAHTGEPLELQAIEDAIGCCASSRGPSIRTSESLCMRVDG